MAIDGFRVNLGQPAAKQDLKAMVGKEHISELIEQARKDPNFEKAKGDYEFRLRKHDGQAVLELRRPTTGFFAKLFSKPRRSEERIAAYDAIRQHMTLLSARSGNTLRKDAARDLAGQVLKLDDLTKTDAAAAAFGKLSIGTESLQKSLSNVLATSLKNSIAEDVPLGLAVRKDTMTLLDRAQVSTNQYGQLIIKTPDQGGNGEANLRTVVDFLGKGCQPVGEGPLSLESANDSRLKNLVESFLLHIRSGNDRAISRPVEEGMTKETGIFTFAKLTAMEITVRAGDRSLEVNVFQSSNLQIGPPGDVVKALEFGAKLEFSLPVERLMKGISDADDLTLYRDVDLHIGSSLENLPKTHAEEMNDRIAQTRSEAQRRFEDSAQQSAIEEANRNLNRGPWKSPYDN